MIRFTRTPPPPQFPRQEPSRPAPAAPVAPRPAQVLSNPSTFEAAKPPNPTVASNLRTEQLGDGRSNCLEKAVGLARPGDSIILMSDSKDGVGHALVRRPDGSVVDPNHPVVRYETLGQWQAMNPRYSQPVAVPAAQVKQVLSTPPGEKRDALIGQLGLSGVANRKVADGEPYWVTPDGGANLRSDPSTNADPLRGLKPGDKLQVLGESNGWREVRMPDGTTGWLSTQVAVSETEAPPPPPPPPAPPGPPRFPDWLAQGTCPPNMNIHLWNGMSPQFQKEYIQAEREKAVAKDWPPPEFDLNGPPPPSIDAMTWGHLSSEGRQAILRQDWQAAVREHTSLLFDGIPAGGTRVDHPFLGVDSELGRGQVGMWKEFAVQLGSAAQYFNVNKVFDEGVWEKAHYNLCGPLSVGASLDLNPQEALTEFRDTNGSATAAVLKENQTTEGSQLMAMYVHAGWKATYDRDELPPPQDMARLLADGKQLITLVNINVPDAGGKLAPYNTTSADDQTRVAHWVNVLAVEQTGTGDWMVRVYNPFDNREEVYGWNDFTTSWGMTNGGNPYGMVIATPPAE